MSLIVQRATRLIHWVWSHIATAVVLVLILCALLIGYSVGSSESNSGVMNDQSKEVAVDEPRSQMYTCSMHPSVRLEDPGAKCPICFMNLIPVAESAGGDGMEAWLVLSESAKTMSQIETAEVGRFYPSAESRLYGKLVYDQTSVARISSYFPGRIDRLFVNYIGVPIQQGDHLAELYSPDLLAAFEELRQAKNSYEKAGDVSSFLRDTAAQTLAASREKLGLLGLTLEQIGEVETGSFDSDRLTIYAPIGGVVTHLAVREGDYLDTGDPIATVSNLKRLWLDLEAYESQLPLLRWGLPVTFTVEAHPGEVFEGRVSFIEPTVDLRTRTVSVRVAVDNSGLRLKPGMFAAAVVHAKVAADGAVISDEFAGKWVSPMHPTIVKDQSGSCDICGMDLMSAESLGIVGDLSNIEMPMVIPRSAVLFTGTRSVVYVQIPDQSKPTYEGRVIQLGVRAGNYYTVRSGLEEGDRVVVNGAFRIDSAMQILAKPSMMMRGVGALAQEDSDRTVPEVFLDGLSLINTAYLDAQERLANDDIDGFLGAAQRLRSVVDSVDSAGILGESFGVWQRASVDLKSGASATTIGNARILFESMTQAILDLQNRFGNASDEPLYTAFCPMAFDFKGALWIQRGIEINNPYFGSEMLRCGDIREMLEPISQPISQPINEGVDEDGAMDSTSQMQHKGHGHE